MQDIKVNISEYMPVNNRADKKDKNLKKACKEFESILTYQLLKSMRRTIEKNDLFHGGQGEEIYESFLDLELAKNMAGSGHNSLGSLLYGQLKRHDITGTGQEEDIKGGGDPKSKPPAWPLKTSVSSEFGWRKDPINGQDRFHYGVDLAAEEGTKIKASLPGRVLFSDYQHDYGNLVVLDHGHGFTTLYAHNQRNLVDPGAWVQRGSPVAMVGSSGRSTGPHLHFEVRRDGRHLDPLEFLGA